MPGALPQSLASEDANCVVGEDAATRSTTRYGYRSEQSVQSEKSPTATGSLTGSGTNAIGSALVFASTPGAVEYVGWAVQNMWEHYQQERGTFHRCISRLHRILRGIRQSRFMNSLLLPLHHPPPPEFVQDVRIFDEFTYDLIQTRKNLIE